MDVDLVAVAGEGFTQEEFEKMKAATEKNAAAILKWFMASKQEADNRVKK